MKLAKEDLTKIEKPIKVKEYEEEGGEREREREKLLLELT